MPSERELADRLLNAVEAEQASLQGGDFASYQAHAEDAVEALAGLSAKTPLDPAVLAELRHALELLQEAVATLRPQIAEHAAKLGLLRNSARVAPSAKLLDRRV